AWPSPPPAHPVAAPAHLATVTEADMPNLPTARTLRRGSLRAPAHSPAMRRSSLISADHRVDGLCRSWSLYRQAAWTSTLLAAAPRCSVFDVSSKGQGARLAPPEARRASWSALPLYRFEFTAACRRGILEVECTDLGYADPIFRSGIPDLIDLRTTPPSTLLRSDFQDLSILCYKWMHNT
ncbi:hypothetical protein Dimus_003749, partial [Dionaea muscipula]